MVTISPKKTKKEKLDSALFQFSPECFFVFVFLGPDYYLRSPHGTDHRIVQSINDPKSHL